MSLVWLVAKYVADIERGEPSNVGLMLIDQDSGEVLSRFIGESDNGAIDGRSAKWAASLDNYKLWVEHWRRSAKEPDALLSESAKLPAENYFLQSAGQFVGLPEHHDAHDVFEDLYSRLVDRTPTQSEPIGRLAEKVLQRVAQRLPNEVERDSVVRVKVDDAVDELAFDYRYNNGVPHMMQKVPLTYTDARSWDRLHAVSWSFSQLQNAQDIAYHHAETVALVRTREPDDALEDQLRFLEKQAYVVDLSETDKAVETLVSMFSD